MSHTGHIKIGDIRTSMLLHRNEKNLDIQAIGLSENEELQKAWFNAFSTLEDLQLKLRELEEVRKADNERFRATIYQLEQELQNRNNTQSQKGGIPSLLNPKPMTADVGHTIALSQE
ncbi:hypothetical protein H112_07912 [Trichophyton rubrum D6]|uniref:Uncharacterized protein n=2 Tax=Trichophyton TaxID=5550 RepID=A0A022VQ70_TRIRU|nr:hypothetical protein H100_07939 [Trichophyton rubrum MR850]EZF37878.1 hypothetical protein H102_07899 [Trichophyton rubrum CBS 100081]EZF48442.1 hypothetical protein H103_07924 [Trichophyton rubrum CBS 288.86]EZF59138.1 hypothetical protein H104_07871 [Trichophyton rubrum CBS 289.86]EZF69695.1 hypothetical protein H105_07925 [Trichophyton soudanense CBS 452.61]EZG02196.1 hypothetical protein H106_07765 [Trichophyton rubrum CBS 735.88]EZG12595.1 hypothetical protein H107_08064 [Trichophyton